MRRLLNAVLTFAGVEKFSEIRNPATHELVEAGYETVYYSAPGARYVAVMRGMEDGRAAGHDGLVVGASEEAAERMEKLRLLFPSTAHVYDVRKGSYCGYADSVETELAAGDAAVFALLHAKIERMEINSPGEVKPGERFDIKLKTVTADGGCPAFSVFAVSFTSPSGKYAWEYAENIACPGETIVSRRLPFNAEHGLWTVTAKDAASGVKAEAKIMVSSFSP
jgi:hypothetical protein